MSLDADASARVVAQPPPSLAPTHALRPAPGLAGVRLVADLDDSDQDGVADAMQAQQVPTGDAFEMTARAARGELQIEGPIRLLVSGEPRTTLHVRGALTFQVQGVAASERAGDARVRLVDANGASSQWTFTVVGLGFLRADGSPLHDATESLGISHEITNDAGLPRGAESRERTSDAEAVRVRVHDASGNPGSEVGLHAGALSNRPHIALAPAGERLWRSAWFRLVGDAVDEQAPTVGAQTLRVALRDQVEIRYASPTGVLRQSARVGRPGGENGARAARRGNLRVRVLRARPGGRPSVGSDDAGALAIAREQVTIANEIWLQCFTDFGPASEADVAVVDPPPPYLLAIADQDGLPAAGDGVIRLRVEGRPLPPVPTRPGDTPAITGLRIARALEAAGYSARVLENLRVGPGAGPSADVLVRREDGALATLSPDGDLPLSGDSRQRLRIAVVDLQDGLEEFENVTAVAGSLEERALLHAVMDDDLGTIDIIIVPSFSRQTRQGESFIEADRGTLVNAVVLDRNGIAGARSAWTQSHELGHVLLDEPFHPDNVGPNRPWLLMDADSNEPSVEGPKRITWDQCLRVRDRSGLDAAITLLRRRSESR